MATTINQPRTDQPQKVTFQDLVTLAKSADANDRKRGFDLFTIWVNAAPKLPPSDRLSQMERSILTQMFAPKGSVPSSRR